MVTRRQIEGDEGEGIESRGAEARGIEEGGQGVCVVLQLSHTLFGKRAKRHGPRSTINACPATTHRIDIIVILPRDYAFPP